MMNSTDVPLVDQVVQLVCIFQQPKFYIWLTESVNLLCTPEQQNLIIFMRSIMLVFQERKQSHTPIG